MSGAPEMIFQNAEAYERIMGRWSRKVSAMAQGATSVLV
jgi:hypothetical protein